MSEQSSGRGSRDEASLMLLLNETDDVVIAPRDIAAGEQLLEG